MANNENLDERIRKAFALKNPAARQEALTELVALLDLNPESNAPELDTLVVAIGGGGLQRGQGECCGNKHATDRHSDLRWLRHKACKT